MKLKGKVALVTGASRGIGRSCAIELAREGADIAINYRSHSDEAEEVARAVRETGRRALTLQGDVADRKRDEELVETTSPNWAGSISLWPMQHIPCASPSSS